jgi:hypothetical protein
VKKELARQDEAWGRAKQALARIGDARITVPHELLEQLEAPVQVFNPGPVVTGVRA